MMDIQIGNETGSFDFEDYSNRKMTDGEVLIYISKIALWVIISGIT